MTISKLARHTACVVKCLGRCVTAWSIHRRHCFTEISPELGALVHNPNSPRRRSATENNVGRRVVSKGRLHRHRHGPRRHGQNTIVHRRRGSRLGRDARFVSEYNGKPCTKCVTAMTRHVPPASDWFWR